jgi:formylmethanofuran dehydrogenase subunit E
MGRRERVDVEEDEDAMSENQTPDDLHRAAMLNVYGAREIKLDAPIIATEHIDECDLCHEEHPITSLIWDGRQLLCARCMVA